MANHNFKLSGIVKNSLGLPLPNLRIEAWDRDMIVNDFVGEAFTDISGKFTISFTGKRFQELFFDASPDIYFKIYDDKELVHSTENNVLWNVKQGDQDLTIVIDTKEGSNLPLNQDIAARTMEIGKVAGIKPEAIARITKKNIPIDRIDEASLDELVKDKLITASQKDDLIMVSRLGLVSGGNAHLLTALKEKKIQSPLDLIAWEK